MVFYAKYRIEDNELLWTQDGPIEDVEEGTAVKKFNGDLGVRVWNPSALKFEAYVYEPPELPQPPDPFYLQQQIDDLTTAWLEG